MPRKYIAIISFLVLAIAVPVTVWLALQRQEIRKKAAVPGGTATFSLSAPDTVAVGETLPLTIKIKGDTQDNKGIIGIKATLEYSFEGENPLSLTDADITADLAELDNHWNYYLRDVTPSDNKNTITVEAVYLQVGPEGYTGAETEEQTFTTLNFITRRPAEITFKLVDQSRSAVRAKEQNLDVLNIDLAQTTVKITEAGAPAQPTATATAAPEAPTVTPTETPETVATPTTAVGGPQPTATPTQAAAPTATPTIVSQPPTATPTKAPVKLTSISSGQTLTTSRPTFAGTASPYAQISITIQSEPIRGQTTADAQGNWSWTPSVDIPSGSHTITIVATATDGSTTTLTDTFTIAAGGEPAATATPTVPPKLPVTATPIPLIIGIVSGAILLILGVLL